MTKYKSFKDAFIALGYKEKEAKAKPEKEIKCRVCGAPMKRVPGTNVVQCTGTITKNGKEERCKNFLLWNNVA